MRTLFAVALIVVAAAPASAQTWQIVTDPANANAKIYRLKRGGTNNIWDLTQLVLLGTGTATFRVQTNDPNTLVVHADGYAAEQKVFARGERQPNGRTHTVAFANRVVGVTTLPYDASFSVDGAIQGTNRSSYQVHVPRGRTVTAELRKPGFVTARRVYSWADAGQTGPAPPGQGATLPPLTDRLELADRLVNVTVSSGTMVFKDGVAIGENNADVTIPPGACAVAKAEKPGWQPAERTYCNRDGVPPPPLTDTLTPSGRVVNVNAPVEARIFINQKQAGLGAARVLVNAGTCVRLRIDQPGFVSESREYCDQTNAPAPPLEESVTLASDDSYPASATTDQANQVVSIEVGAGRTEEASWRTIAAIVTNSIEALELSDRETGYLRTAWQYRPYAAGRVVIRTRIIVTRQSTLPLRYNVRISSERNKTPGVTTRDDENYEAWGRLLASYKDVIVELQSRLK